MKPLLIVSFLIITSCSFSQSVSVSDLQNFVVRAKKISEKYLVDKGFIRTSFKLVHQTDTLWAYRTVDESVYLGDSYITKQNRKLRAVTYMTSNPEFVVSFMQQIKTAGFNYERDELEPKSGGKWIFLSNIFYSVQIFLDTRPEEYTSIMLVEK